MAPVDMRYAISESDEPMAERESMEQLLQKSKVSRRWSRAWSPPCSGLRSGLWLSKKMSIILLLSACVSFALLHQVSRRASPLATQNWSSRLHGSREWLGRMPVIDHSGESPHDLRLNQLQLIGTHNSYHREMRPRERYFFKAFPGYNWDLFYSFASLTDQFKYQSVRSIELDIYADSKGGNYAHPWSRKIAGLEPPDKIVMMQPGTKVLHISDADVGTTCLTLVECLTQVRAWSSANPRHVPVPIMLEFKQAKKAVQSYLRGAFSEEWTTSNLDILDEEIRSVFSKDQLLTPDDMRRGNLTLEQSVLQHGWPSLESSRGKFFFIMDNNITKPIRDAYRAGGRNNLEGRTIFTNSLPGEPDAAFIKMNNPGAGNLAVIQEMVSKGYFIRTRADEFIRELMGKDTIRRDMAFASGAQIISTDWPGVGMAARHDSDYVVRFPDGAAARCNPVNAPAECSDLTLEPLS